MEPHDLRAIFRARSRAIYCMLSLISTHPRHCYRFESDLPALLPGNQLLATATSVVASATRSVFAQENFMLIESSLAKPELIQRRESC